jgi:transglutaminase-like putative cysteine protease
MSTRYSVRHRTTYRYSERMTRGHTVSHLVPRSGSRQTLEYVDISVTPEPGERIEFDDAFGNRVLQFVVAESHDQLVIEANSSVFVRPHVPVSDRTPWDAAHHWPSDVAGFTAPSPFATPTEAVERFAQPFFGPGRAIVDVAHDLCSAIFHGFTFDPSFSEVATPVDEVIRARRGVCQDFAHLAIVCLRTFGLPARYVSGYLETVPPPGQPKMIGADASHAWCSVALGDGTWLDFDPTNDQVPPQRHIVTAYGRDYLDVAPVQGVVVGPMATQTLEVAVDVNALDGPD